MKKWIFLVLALLLTGCSAEYNLEISNDSFKEKIVSYIDKSEIPTEQIEDIEIDDPITPFLNNKYSALYSKDTAYYNKKVIDLENQYKVEMKYNYTAKDFSDSNSLKLCFENYEFDYEDNYYIAGYGNFMCLYSDEININIKTKNKVINHNADSVNGNVYTWVINKENADNVNIEIEIEKGFNYRKLIYPAVIIGIIILLITIIIAILNKRKKVNEI